MSEWAGLIESWLVSLRAGGRRPATLGLRRYQLERVAAAMRLLELAPTAVTGAHLVAWVGAYEWERETLRSMRSALCSFFGWALLEGIVPSNPATSLPRVKPGEPNPRPTPEDTYRAALLEAAGDERVRLMLRLAAELGMRRGEVAVAHRRDLERDLTGWSLAVHGKGGKERRVPLSDGLAAAIRTTTDLGYLFPGRVDGHLSAHYVGKLVARALPGAWAMHSLRHRFCTVAYAVDRDLLTVQELAGHASPVTTRRYVQVPADAARRTVAAVAAAS